MSEQGAGGDTSPGRHAEVDRSGAGDLMIGPATRLLWRGPDTVQLELGDTGVIVDGLPLDAIRSVASRAPSPALRPTESVHVAPLSALREAGYLWPRQARPGPGVAAPGEDVRLAPPHPRLAGELRALQVGHGEAASQVLAARSYASVQVEGAHRAAAHVGSVLAAAGIGRVRCTAAGHTTLAHASPGGVNPANEGNPFAAAADAALHRAAPDVDATPLGTTADLTLLVLDAPLPDERRDALHAADAAHLCVSVGVDRGVVGPLVVPGLSSCVRCADLERRDRDPAWNALAVQLAVPSRYGHASAVALATMVAGVAAMQALAFLDGEHPATLDGTLEIAPPDWRLRRRSWAVHPDCGCTSAE